MEIYSDNLSILLKNDTDSIKEFKSIIKTNPSWITSNNFELFLDAIWYASDEILDIILHSFSDKIYSINHIEHKFKEIEKFNPSRYYYLQKSFNSYKSFKLLQETLIKKK